MPRPLRIKLAGLTFHVVQRGHNRAAAFVEPADYLEYLTLLEAGARRYETHVHAYVLMTNHVHLLLTSELDDGVSRLLQHVAGRYVARFNARHGRTGTLWEGRFRSSPVDSDRYCLACYRYIELNPVRAGIARHPGDYRWSSYRANSSGAPSSLVTPHPTFLTLGSTRLERAARYQQLVAEAMPETLIEEIRHGLHRGVPTGCMAFRQNVGAAAGRTFDPPPRGRPRKRAEK